MIFNVCRSAGICLWQDTNGFYFLQFLYVIQSVPRVSVADSALLFFYNRVVHGVKWRFHCVLTGRNHVTFVESVLLALLGGLHLVFTPAILCHVLFLAVIIAKKLPLGLIHVPYRGVILLKIDRVVFQ